MSNSTPGVIASRSDGGCLLAATLEQQLAAHAAHRRKSDGLGGTAIDLGWHPCRNHPCVVVAKRERAPNARRDRLHQIGLPNIRTWHLNLSR